MENILTITKLYVNNIFVYIKIEVIGVNYKTKMTSINDLISESV